MTHLDPRITYILNTILWKVVIEIVSKPLSLTNVNAVTRGFLFQLVILLRTSSVQLKYNLEHDRPCDIRNPRDRVCLLNQTSVLGGFHHLTHDW